MFDCKYFSFLFFAFLSQGGAKNCGYESCAKIDPDALNVHMVSHSHDDVGWVKTIDEYYTQQVDHIISSVVDSLKANPDRRFIQVETAFLHLWWNQETSKREEFRELVQNGQLEIVGGGWSMNDEAAAHYQSIIDQFTLGLRFINDTLGECGLPKIGWQIDPFGHTREMASIFAGLGYEAMFFGRLDFRDKTERMDTKTSELIWRGDDYLGNNSDIFTSILYHLYQAPPGFCFDETLCNDKINDGNVNAKVSKFLSFIDEQSTKYPTNNILLTMGGDFLYQKAETFYQGIDYLIKSVQGTTRKSNKKVNIFYSTPSCYIKSVNEYSSAKKLSYKLKTDDFLPFASSLHGYWTGFYTSRPTSKRYERESNNLLQITKQLGAITRDTNNNDIFELSRAIGVMQHHDAITGTEKQYVANDYARTLSSAREKSIEENSKRLNSLLLKQKDSVQVKFESCALANMTICDVSGADNFLVTLYNPLAHSVSHYVRLPVDITNFKITDYREKILEYQISQNIRDFKKLQLVDTKNYELTFFAHNIPAMGTKTYYIQTDGDEEEVLPTSDASVLGTKELGLTLDPDGCLESVFKNDLNINVRQKMLWYRAHKGSNMGTDRSSGAYTFQPEGEAIDFKEPKKVNVFIGNLYDEVHQEFSSWATQVIRVYKGMKKYIEFDWVVGPILVDNYGKEIITRFETSLKSREIFFTDSNGRGSILRRRNYRDTYKFESDENVTGNYYPVNSHIKILDVGQGIYFSVFNDRAQGGSSIKDGEIELMLHRRLLKDDSWGVDEALNEREVLMGAVARGQHIIDFGNIGEETEEQIQLQLSLKPWTFLSKVGISFKEIKENVNLEFSALSTNLPKDLHFLTLEPWKLEENKILIRLEHVGKEFEAIIVNLKDIFKDYQIVSMEEMTLGANQILSENKRFNWTVGDKLGKEEVSKISNSVEIKDNLRDLVIALQMKQIRTFIATIEYKKHDIVNLRDVNVVDVNNDSDNAGEVAKITLFIFSVIAVTQLL